VTGNKRPSVVLQPRDRQLLTALATMRVIDREQAKVVAGFPSTNSANGRLLLLTRAGLLKRFFTGTIGGGRKAIYTLTDKAAAVVGAEHGGLDRKSDQTVVGDVFIEHQMHINRVFLAFRYVQPSSGARFVRWQVFYEPVLRGVPVIPDGYCEVEAGGNVRAMFLEVDLGTESLSIWEGKARAYLDLALSGEFSKMFSRPQFRVLVIANSQRRLANIRAVISKRTDKIFWFATFNDFDRAGVWSPIWLRPWGDQRHSLT
jgi:hypothetical protein